MTNNSVVDFADAEFRNANPDEALLDSPQNRNTGTVLGWGWVIVVLFHDGDSTSEQEGATTRILTVKMVLIR